MINRIINFPLYFSDSAAIYLMRSIVHPGNPNPVQIQALPGYAQTEAVVIQPGQSFLQALIDAVTPFSTQSAVLCLKNGAFEPFCYVMPALSKSAAHAVYFSDRFDVTGKVSLETATVTYGVRDGQPWLHCHAVWIEPDGTRRCGHLLPEDIQVSEPIDGSVSILRDVAFSVEPDAETNFSLFVPVVAGDICGAELVETRQSIFAVRLSPNTDVCDSLEKFCQMNRICRATILGGVGSTVGAVFDDGRIVEPFVTEMLIRRGVIQTRADQQLVAEIDISMVDYLGGISEGRLKRGENPVLVTFELVLSVDELASTGP